MADIEAMFQLARAAMDRAYAPYSGFHVGACVRGAYGGLYAGCNVENASYPHGWCAEPSALSALIAAGERRVVEVVVIGARSDGEGGYADDPGLLCTPCGGCRQKLREFAAPDTPVHVCGPDGLRRTFTVDELLPASFGPHSLAGS